VGKQQRLRTDTRSFFNSLSALQFNLPRQFNAKSNRCRQSRSNRINSNQKLRWTDKASALILRAPVVAKLAFIGHSPN
jgi:hypothetical protein